MNWKPEGYNSVSPYLIAKDARAVITFLQKAFDGKELRCYERPDGTIMHAEVKLDDTVVMIGGSSEAGSAAPSHVHMYVQDAMKTYQRALEAGGESVQEPVKKEGEPDQRGGVLDPSGNIWWMSTQVVNE
ncbi:VOC family protein [Virgibacillus flavescens]|uniref:VOC family protein n=1 Tax=Virgibacillus flavescens TaxID=1611422 RepID=UPI003D34944B